MRELGCEGGGREGARGPPPGLGLAPPTCLPRPPARPTHLSGQCDGAGLTLGADACGPGRVCSAPLLHTAAQVLHVGKLAPAKEEWGRGMRGGGGGGRRRSMWEVRGGVGRGRREG